MKTTLALLIVSLITINTAQSGPPLPPGVKLPIKKPTKAVIKGKRLQAPSDTRAPVITAPKSVATVTFSAASFTEERPLQIYPFGPNLFIVYAKNTNTVASDIELQWTDTLVGGAWHFLAGFGGVPPGEYVAAQIPANWEPYGRMFVKVAYVFSGTAVVASPPPNSQTYAASERLTAATATLGGKTYSLYRIVTPPSWNSNGNFAIYKLKLYQP